MVVDEDSTQEIERWPRTQSPVVGTPSLHVITMATTANTCKIAHQMNTYKRTSSHDNTYKN